MKKRKMLLWVIKRSVCDHSSLFVPTIFSFHTLSLYFLCGMSYNSSHLRNNSINFSSNSEDNQAGLSQVNTRSEWRWRNYCSHDQIRARRTSAVTSNILTWGRRRNGTETWRRRSCQCKHLRLITYEKSLLNGDVPRRNGNVTYRVNRP